LADLLLTTSDCGYLHRMNYHFIAVEGNIGAGKTTLAHLLARHFNSRLILEEYAENPFLAKFYENPKQYAFPLELFFMAERYKQLKELVHTKDLFQRVTISDYIFSKCLLFAKVNLPDEEFHLYQKLFDIIYQQLVQPDILIYLHTPVHQLQKKIRKRNRPYEQNIPDDYLFSLQETYTNYIRQHDIKTLFIDAANADFLGNETHFQVILDALEKDYEPGRHYFSLP
jgi:deoxyguanosine kinase